MAKIWNQEYYKFWFKTRVTWTKVFQNGIYSHDSNVYNKTD